MTLEEFITLRDKWLLRFATVREAGGTTLHITPEEYAELKDLDWEWQKRDNERAVKKGWPSVEPQNRYIAKMEAISIIVDFKGKAFHG